MTSLSTPFAAKTKLVHDRFLQRFNSEPLIVKAPGRINLLGEHTDYNNGFVMPAAIDKGIYFAIGVSNTAISVVYSIKYDEYAYIDQKNPEKVESPAWANYLLGILYQMKEKGFHIPAFNCVFDGDLPTGAGLSSSAAMECGFAFAMDQLLNLKITRRDMALMGQWAEHHFVGVKCGIMDQFASLMGKENHVIVLDCRSLAYNYFPLDLKDHELLLLDSGVKHSLASSEYNTRRQECEQGTLILRNFYPEVESLRDISSADVIKHKNAFPEKVFNRCLYVTQENERVQMAEQDLLQGRLDSFGEKMYETHQGLSELYEVSCVELDFLVDYSKKQKEIPGARMMGGGFGGCTLNIIKKHASPSFVQSITDAYKSAFGIDLKAYTVSLSDGTSVQHI